MTTAANEFMMNLHKALQERGLTDSTVKTYIRTLMTINDKKPFKSLAFLKKKEDLLKKMEGYADTTKKAIIATICSVLASHKDKGYKKCYNEWSELLKDKKEAVSTEGLGKKTEKEADAWLSWKEIEAKREEMRTAIEPFINSKKITPDQFDLLQRYTLLALYTLIPPRRNLDYLDMAVINKESPDLPKDKNYLVLEGQVPSKFIFNKYKSVKKHGSQTETIPAALSDVIKHYIHFHPLKPTKMTKKTELNFPFLVSPTGDAIHTVNFITRALNKTFGRKVGSSMLRHIYLSSKYDLEEMKRDSDAMGHDVQTQRNYLRIVDDDEKHTV